MQAIDAFIDLSLLENSRQVSAAMDRLAGPDALDGFAGELSCAARSVALARAQRSGDRRWRLHTGTVIDACSDAMARACASHRPLLVLIGDLDVGSDAVGVLAGAIAEDPMIGFAAPRLKGARDIGVAVLDRGGDRAFDDLPRRMLAEISDTYLVADTPVRCLLIRADVVAEFGALDGRFLSLAGALAHCVGRARRCGFRTVICNRAVVGAVDLERTSLPSALTPMALCPHDRALLRDVLPDLERTREEFGTRALASAETRLARALPAAYGTRPSLLVDVRNIGRAINGTATAALGIAAGLRALDSDWDVALLARREAATAHQLATLFPGWRVHTSPPDRQFTVALRLSQPWHVQELIELHKLAAFNVCLFLDTISWDTAYPAPRQLQGAWEFMADYVDGLVYISEFSRDRFCRRFAAGAAVPSLVSHLSFEPSDYIRSDWRVSAGHEGALFVVGNGYDHKDVSQTLELLTRAFPYQPIVALGPAPAPTPRVTVLESGTVSEVDLHRLYAGSRAVVFPSFYEGFGFPVVTTLAYGRTVLARRSALLEEIAAQCAARGRLIPFGRRDDLVDLIGRLLHGQDVPELPLGTALAGRPPKSWRAVAESILVFLADLTRDVSRSRWRPREHAIRQMLAAAGDVNASTGLAVSS